MDSIRQTCVWVVDIWRSGSCMAAPISGKDKISLDILTLAPPLPETLISQNVSFLWPHYTLHGPLSSSVGNLWVPGHSSGGLIQPLEVHTIQNKEAAIHNKLYLVFSYLLQCWLFTHSHTYPKYAFIWCFFSVNFNHMVFLSSSITCQPKSAKFKVIKYMLLPQNCHAFNSGSAKYFIFRQYKIHMNIVWYTMIKS